MEAGGIDKSSNWAPQQSSTRNATDPKDANELVPSAVRLNGDMADVRIYRACLSKET